MEQSPVNVICGECEVHGYINHLIKIAIVTLQKWKFSAPEPKQSPAILPDGIHNSHIGGLMNNCPPWDFTLHMQYLESQLDGLLAWLDMTISEFRWQEMNANYNVTKVSQVREIDRYTVSQTLTFSSVLAHTIFYFRKIMKVTCKKLNRLKGICCIRSLSEFRKLNLTALWKRRRDKIIPSGRSR